MDFGICDLEFMVMYVSHGGRRAGYVLHPIGREYLLVWTLEFLQMNPVRLSERNNIVSMAGRYGKMRDGREDLRSAARMMGKKRKRGMK